MRRYYSIPGCIENNAVLDMVVVHKIGKHTRQTAQEIAIISEIVMGYTEE